MGECGGLCNVGRGQGADGGVSGWDSSEHVGVGVEKNLKDGAL